MKNRVRVGVIGVVVLVTISIVGATVKKGDFTNILDGNSNENIKKSIACFQKNYIVDSKSIDIIDEFNYEDKKVVLFSCADIVGYANFNQDNDGSLKISFVQTYNKNNEREISK